MATKRSKLTIDGDKDRETLNHLVLLFTAASAADDGKFKIQIHDRKAKENLKRPRSADPDPDTIPPPKPVFDSEDDDDGDNAGNQDPAIQLADQIPEEGKRRMNFMGLLPGSNPRVLAEKRLTWRDVEERRNRLLIPATMTRFDFLEVEEEEELNRRIWWPVEIIEPDCTVSLVTLSKWETKTGPAYVFITEWSYLVDRNHLKEGDLLRLWSFRAHGGAGAGEFGRLCFMLLEIVGV